MARRRSERLQRLGRWRLCLRRRRLRRLRRLSCGEAPEWLCVAALLPGTCTHSASFPPERFPPQADGGAGDASFKGKGLHASGKPLGAKKGRHDAQRRDGEKKRRAKEQAAADGARAAPPAAASLSVDSRLLSALLTGINRAFPFVDSDKVDSLVERVSPDIFRIAHAQSLHGAVQALTLLFQMMTARSATSDRFYRALYEVQLVRRRSGASILILLVSNLSLARPRHLCFSHVSERAGCRLSFSCAEPGPYEELVIGDVPVAALQGA